MSGDSAPFIFEAEPADDVRRAATAYEADERRRRRRRGTVLAFWCYCALFWAAILIPFICSLTTLCNAPPPAPPPVTPAPVTPAPATAEDCCPQDEFVYLNSPYVSAEPTLCGTTDYNCDNVTDTLACCHGATVVPDPADGRVIYMRGAFCNNTAVTLVDDDANEVCGACQGESTVVFGWACAAGISRKRFMPHCPTDCGELLAVTPETPPDVGECALYVDHCAPNGGDGERCCLVVTQ